MSPIRVAAATEGVIMFHPRKKNYPTLEFMPSGSGRHHRCPIMLSPREQLAQKITVCALITRDLFAIAKYLVLALTLTSCKITELLNDFTTDGL